MPRHFSVIFALFVKFALFFEKAVEIGTKVVNFLGFIFKVFFFFYIIVYAAVLEMKLSEFHFTDIQAYQNHSMIIQSINQSKIYLKCLVLLSYFKNSRISLV